MSSLDHTLVCANSLTGIGTVDEALDVLVPKRRPGLVTLFDEAIYEALTRARDVLVEVAKASELDSKESKAASRATMKARKDAEEAKLLFDAAVLTRIGRAGLVAGSDVPTIADAAATSTAQEALWPLQPAHMPLLFPEVFLRDNGGFDVLIGNPPWEELVVDETRFWASKSPGLLALPQAARDAEILVLRKARPDLSAEYESLLKSSESARKILYSAYAMGPGDADLFRAFAIRNWQLTSSDGLVGLVLPKTAFSAAGLESWRRALLEGSHLRSLVILLNNKRWVFPIHPQYKVALATISKSSSEKLLLGGPFASLEEFARGQLNLVEIDASEVLSMTQAASVPEIRDQTTANILSQMRKSDSVGSIAGSRIELVSEFHATNDKKYFSDRKDARSLPVYSGKSFEIYNPETSETFAWASPSVAITELRKRLDNQLKLRRSAFFGLDIESDLGGRLPCQTPRIAFRGITSSTNSRTVICALVPPNTLLTNISPYILVAPHNPVVEAFLLGVFNSVVFDWYARRFVETQMNFHLVRSFPVPYFDLSNMECRRIVSNAGSLSAVDNRFLDWSIAVGVPVGSVKISAEREDLEAELDALVAHLYGLTRDHVEHIFNTFHRGWDYQPRLTKVLAHFDRITEGKK